MKIINARIITAFGILENHSLTIKNDRIEKIESQDRIDLNREVIYDAGGNFLSPGLIDIHNHGNSGFDFMDASEEALDAISLGHIKNGITSYLGTIITNSASNMMEASSYLSNYKDKEGHARCLGVHLEGPNFGFEKRGAQNTKHLVAPSLDLVEGFLSIPGERIRMVSLDPSLKNSFTVIDRWLEAGKKVALGHTSADYETTNEAFKRGANIVTHLYNAMNPFDHREPGCLGASLSNDNVFCEIIYDRIHIHDVAMDLALRCKGYDKLILVSDAIRGSGIENGDSELGGQRVIIKDGVARLESGQLAGSTLNLKTAVKNLIKYLDIELFQAIKMASLNPAKALGLDRELGSIEEGKIADLLVLDDNLNIKDIFLEGELII